MHSELPKAKELEQKLFAINNEAKLVSIALEVYHFQFANNPVYQSYCKAINRTPEDVHQLEQIPFLPIRFFKSHTIKATTFEAEVIFESSGTTQTHSSFHYVKNAKLYENSFLQGFEKFYAKPEEYCIIGLLPSYLERGNSSLVYMVNHLIKKSMHAKSGFYLHNFEELFTTLTELESASQKTILIGVTYALLDFAEKFPMQLKNTIVMETGGMKGRKKEMIKAELYEELRNGFGVSQIHSEYGMTELLSQAYGIDGILKTPQWMKILLRDETDPLTIYDSSATSGAINVIDLANLYSCSFIATDDIGRTYGNNQFEVLGRMDNSDIRGCSLMVV